MKLYHNGQEVEFSDWSISYNEDDLRVRVTDFRGLRVEYPYSECRIEPTKERDECLIFNRKKNSYEKVEKAIELGEKYILIKYPAREKIYRMKYENVSYAETIEASGNNVLEYFCKVALERVENASGNKIIEENVVSQMGKVPFSCCPAN